MAFAKSNTPYYSCPPGHSIDEFHYGVALNDVKHLLDAVAFLEDLWDSGLSDPNCPWAIGHRSHWDILSNTQISVVSFYFKNKRDLSSFMIMGF